MRAYWQKKLIIFLAVTKNVTQECSIINVAFKVVITSFYEQMTHAVALLDYQQWKNWLKMPMYGLKQALNRVILSSSSPWTNFTLHCVKHFVNHSLIITHQRPLFVEEVRSNHWRYWEKNIKFEQIFYDIRVSPIITAPMIILFSEWTRLMYSRKKCINVDDTRLDIFLQKYKANTITSVKKLDGNKLSHCSRVLLQKIRWTQLITRWWLAATEQKPPPETPENNGWGLDDNRYKILWFEGTATPNIVLVLDLAEDEGWLKIPLNCSHFLLSVFLLS